MFIITTMNKILCSAAQEGELSGGHHLDVVPEAASEGDLPQEDKQEDKRRQNSPSKANIRTIDLCNKHANLASRSI